jgi:hypothetical protein
VAETIITVELRGVETARISLGRKKRGSRKAMKRATRDTTLSILRRVKTSFGQTGRPRRGTGALSRGVVDDIEELSGVIVGRVGVLAIVPYGRILELGGTIPEHRVAPIRAKVLRWVTGVTRLGQLAGLGFGVTRRQASGAGRKFSKSDVFDPSDVHWFRPSASKAFLTIPARYQRAIPYLRPSMQEEIPLMPGTYRRHLVEGLKA